MPVFKSKSGQAPEWSELKYFEIIHLPGRVTRKLEWKSPRSKLFAGKGNFKIVLTSEERKCFQNDVIDISDYNSCEISSKESAIVIFTKGNWQEPTGGCGVFSLENSVVPQNTGDSIDHEIRTSLDYHYHDCDEFWIIFEGRGKALSEGIIYELSPGSCLATRMGDHHTMLDVYKTIYGIYFETTLKGKKRTGHLWEHTHGPAKNIN